MTNKYDAVFYDFDGTLADTIPLITMSFKLAYERVFGHCARSYEDFLSYIGKPLEAAFAMHDEKTAKELYDAYLDINEKLLREDAVDLFPKVREDLLYLKSLGIKQGIMTSKMRTSLTVTTDLKGITDIFDVIVTKEDTKKHKPDGEPLITAAGKLGLTDMSRILYVGDALPDMLCAYDAGSEFALVDWTKMPRDKMTDDPRTLVIRSIRELSCIIQDSEL